KFFPGLSFIIGDTEEEAQAKARRIDSYVSVEGLLAHLAVVDRSGRAYSPETPLSEVDSPALQGRLELLRQVVTDREPTVADLAEYTSARVVGTPETIADALEEWQDAGADGINIGAYIFEDFAEFA